MEGENRLEYDLNELVEKINRLSELVQPVEFISLEKEWLEIVVALSKHKRFIFKESPGNWPILDYTDPNDEAIVEPITEDEVMDALRKLMAADANEASDDGPPQIVILGEEDEGYDADDERSGLDSSNSERTPVILLYDRETKSFVQLDTLLDTSSTENNSAVDATEQDKTADESLEKSDTVARSNVAADGIADEESDDNYEDISVGSGTVTDSNGSDFIQTDLNACRITWKVLGNEVGKDLVMRCRHFCAQVEKRIKQLDANIELLEEVVNTLTELDTLMTENELVIHPAAKQQTEMRLGISRDILQEYTNLKDVVTKFRAALPNDDIRKSTADNIPPGEAFEEARTFPNAWG